MNIKQKIFSLFKNIKQKSSDGWSMLIDRAKMPSSMRPLGVTQQIQVIEEWVYTGITAISQSVGSQRFGVYNNKNEWVDMPDNISKLFKKKDFLFSNIYEKIEYGALFLETTGAMIFYTPKLGKTFLGIYPIPTQYVKFPEALQNISSITDPPEKLAIELGGVRYALPMEELLICFYNSPLTMNKPFSPLNQIRFTVNLNKQVDEYLSWVFDNRAEPSALLSTEQELTTAQANQIKERYLQENKGKDKIGGVSVLGNGVKLEKISYSPTEIQYLQNKRQIKEDVLGLLRVPPVICGITDKSGLGRANAETAEYIFYKYRIMPILQKIQTAFSLHFFPDEKLEFQYEDIIPIDKEYELKKEDMYIKNGIILPNEIREHLGKDPTEFGDVPPMMAGRTLGVGMEFEEEKKMPDIKINVEENKIKSGGVYFESKMYNSIYTIKKLKALRDEKERGRIEKAGTIALIKQFHLIEKILLAQVRKNYQYKPVDKIIKDFSGYIVISEEEIKKHIIDIYKTIMEKSIILGITEFEKDLTRKTLIELTPDSLTLEYIDSYLGIKINNLSKGMQKRLLKTIEEGLNNLESEKQIAERISKQMGIEMNRATTIARTETSMAYNFSYHAGLEEFKMSRMWVSALDEATRDAHLMADGQTVSAGQPFIVDGEALPYPAFMGGSPGNIINCRCQEFGYIN